MKNILSYEKCMYLLHDLLMRKTTQAALNVIHSALFSQFLSYHFLLFFIFNLCYILLSFSVITYMWVTGSEYSC